MTLRPEVQCLVVSLAFVLGVTTGGAVADDGTSGWPQAVLVILILLACVMLLAGFIACILDLFWGRGLTT